jgi:hypothetical protein
MQQRCSPCGLTHRSLGVAEQTPRSAYPSSYQYDWQDIARLKFQLARYRIERQYLVPSEYGSEKRVMASRAAAAFRSGALSCIGAALADLGDPAWRGMVCVETGNIADNEVRLAAGDEHEMSTVIAVDAGP